MKLHSFSQQRGFHRFFNHLRKLVFISTAVRFRNGRGSSTVKGGRSARIAQMQPACCIFVVYRNCTAISPDLPLADFALRIFAARRRSTFPCFLLSDHMQLAANQMLQALHRFSESCLISIPTSRETVSHTAADFFALQHFCEIL